jgi:L-cysteine desulfidase
MFDIEKEQIIRLIKREVVPAIGCTEPVSVAFCVAKATEILGVVPSHINVSLSANVLKNAMGVGIPGTGMIGLPIAVALGALIGKSVYQLEVLKDITPESIAAGKQMIADKQISITLKEDAPDRLYVEATCTHGGQSARVIVSTGHTHICLIEKNGEVCFEEPAVPVSEERAESLNLNLEKVYRFAMETPLEEIRFILESSRLNKAASISAFKGDYGHSLGKTMINAYERGIMGNSMLPRILAYTSAACDARMAGAMIPVMTNSGSGNQGITATLPVVIYAEETGKPEADLIRALTLSHLTVIYIKQSMGRLSALCGCVVASTGSACGITHLMGGGYLEISYAVKNMIANLTGVICDGAKPSCSLKVSSSVSTALFSAMLAMEGKFVTSVEGIIDEDVDKSIQNLTRIASQGMDETDKMILEIMTKK